jgi:hypothetical protein
MRKQSEKNGFDADEMASMSRIYLRCKTKITYADPDQLAISVLLLFRNGVIDEDRVYALLTQRMEQPTRYRSALAGLRNRPTWRA